MGLIAPQEGGSKMDEDNKPREPRERDETFKWMDEGTPNELRVICWYCPECGSGISKYVERCDNCGEAIDWRKKE